MGAEYRQFAARSLNAHRELCELVGRQPRDALVVTVTPQQLQNAARFAEPVVYTQSAGRLGELGAHAHGVVYFFGQISVVRDAIRRIGERYIEGVPLPRNQPIAVAEALLVAAEAAVQALPAFAASRWAGNEILFVREVSEARKAFDRLNAPPTTQSPSSQPKGSGSMKAVVTEQTLLEGSWLALEQAGAMLRDAVRLYEAGSYATAVALALLGREEIGRSRILRKCSSEVHAGAALTVAEVHSRCDGHVRKQAESAFAVVLTPRNDSALGKALGTYSQAAPTSPEWMAAAAVIDQAVKAKAGRQPSDRHDARCEASYVDLLDDGTGFQRPLDLTPEEAYRHVNDATNDYAGERDRLTNLDPHATLAPIHRAAEMRAANARRTTPVELPITGWPRMPGA